MLTDDEKLLAIQRFTNYLAGLDEVRATAVVGLPRSLQAQIDGGTPAVLAPSVIEIAIADGWNSGPPPALIGVLSSFQHFDPKLPEIMARILATPPAVAADPLSMIVLDTSSPFIDRAGLRQRLATFGKDALRPILVVNGAPKSGRSYTKELLVHFCRGPAVTLCCAVKASWTEPKDLAEDLVTAVGGDIADSPPPDSNQERWITQLARWVLIKANRANQHRPTQHWFLLDGFGPADVSRPLRYFIAELANGISNGVNAANFRLILLEFERADLTVMPGRIVTDETAPVEDLEIDNGVKAILTAKGALPVVDHQAFVDLVRQGLPATDRRMPVLNKRLRALLNVLDGVQPRPMIAAALLTGLAERLRQIDDQEAVDQTNAVLAASGKVPAADYPLFAERVLQNLPAGDARQSVLAQRLSDLREVLQ